MVPDARIKVAHGQMTGPQLEKVMTNFIEGSYDVLVATTIIESGLDISNANTIIINEANKYGLSELHQMRGRVALQPQGVLLLGSHRLRFHSLKMPASASRRWRSSVTWAAAFTSLYVTSTLRSRDLLGAEQSGFVTEVGYDMYHKILDESVKELKEEHFGDLFAEEILPSARSSIVDDVKPDLDLEMRLPELYVPSIPERLKLYRRIAGAEKEEELSARFSAR